MQLGMIGLGRMGGNMAERCLRDGHEIVVTDRNADTVANYVAKGAVGSTSLSDFVAKLRKPRAVWMMVPAAIVDSLIAQLDGLLESGDILIFEAHIPTDTSVGDVLAVPVTGAYGHSMGSNYNKVPRPAIVFVDDGEARLVVRRETYEDLLLTDVG